MKKMITMKMIILAMEDSMMIVMTTIIVMLMLRKFAHYLVYSDDAMVRLKELSILLVQFKFRYFHA